MMHCRGACAGVVIIKDKITLKIIGHRIKIYRRLHYKYKAVNIDDLAIGAK